jgi:hypothetical protein
MNPRFLYLGLGHASVMLGVIGVLLPVIPATPFMILAAFFYSKSSPKLHQKILNMPHIGPHVRTWEEHGVISPRAKLLCVLTLILFLGSSIYFLPRVEGKILLALIGIGVMIFVLSRPSYPKK